MTRDDLVKGIREILTKAKGESNLKVLSITPRWIDTSTYFNTDQCELGMIDIALEDPHDA